MSTTEETPRGRILIADDDPAILRLISTILEKENFSVVHARDGREAYKILQSDANFTAAILDVVMPMLWVYLSKRFQTALTGKILRSSQLRMMLKTVLCQLIPPLQSPPLPFFDVISEP